MTREDDRRALALRELHQAERRLADLADATGRSVELVDRRGLDRVHHDDLGRVGTGLLDDAPDLALGEDPDPFAGWAGQQAESAGPEVDLGRRFLAGGV